MKPSFISSYPVRACANEAGIDYDLALAWVDAPDFYAVRDARRAISARHGPAAAFVFVRLIERVYMLGRVRVRHIGPNGDGWASRSGTAS